jgi:hypothetical protein
VAVVVMSDGRSVICCLGVTKKPPPYGGENCSIVKCVEWLCYLWAKDAWPLVIMALAYWCVWGVAATCK